MSNIQKVIKYCAIAFAFTIIVSIFSGIITGITAISSIFNNSDDSISNKFDELYISGDISALDIDVHSVDIIVKEGDSLEVETNSKCISINQDKNKLYITEKKHSFLNNNDSLVIYVPNSLLMDIVSIKNGAGKISIDKLNTDRLSMELGAGRVIINSLIVNREASIDGGAGEMIVSKSILSNLDLDMGVGKLSLTASLIGNSKIDSGIGEVDLNLVGSLDDYKIKIDKGIGSTTIDGNSVQENAYYGTGSNFLEIDGGIGQIKVNFANEIR